MEFDKPEVLMQNETSVFYGMIQEAGLLNTSTANKMQWKIIGILSSVSSRFFGHDHLESFYFFAFLQFCHTPWNSNYFYSTPWNNWYPRQEGYGYFLWENPITKKLYKEWSSQHTATFMSRAVLETTMSLLRYIRVEFTHISVDGNRGYTPTPLIINGQLCADTGAL